MLVVIKRDIIFYSKLKMKNKAEKETHYARCVQSTLYKFGVGICLTKRVTYRYPIRVLEKLIAETEKRQPQDPADYFLNGLKRSRVKYGCNRKVNRKRKERYGLKDTEEKEMALIVKDTLIRKRDGALPAGSSGFFVSVPSVFLLGLSDGDKIIGEIEEGEETREITLILEKETGDSLLHIISEGRDMNFMKEGRANLRLKEAIQGAKEKRKQLYSKNDVTTSPAIGCRIS